MYYCVEIESSIYISLRAVNYIVFDLPDQTVRIYFFIFLCFVLGEYIIEIIIQMVDKSDQIRECIIQLDTLAKCYLTSPVCPAFHSQRRKLPCVRMGLSEASFVFNDQFTSNYEFWLTRCSVKSDAHDMHEIYKWKPYKRSQYAYMSGI